MTGKNIATLVVIGCLVFSITATTGGIYYFYKKMKTEQTSDKISEMKGGGSGEPAKEGGKNSGNGRKSDDEKTEAESPVNSLITLVAYRGQVFSAKVPRGWSVTDNESGIDIMDPSDNNTGASSAVAVGWFGKSSPDEFIKFMAGQIGLSDIKYLSVSDEGSVKDPISGLDWVMKTKILTCKNKQGIPLEIKASAGVMNGYGQYIALLTAFQTTPDKWDQWAPMLERIATSIVMTNPQKAGGIDKVRLPSASDLANDSSPLMESWEYRNQVQDRTSHNFSDAIMGMDTGLVSPSTGRTYDLPLSSYDPTEGGYHNPDDYSEILADPYQ